MLIEQPARFLRWLYPSALWRMETDEKSVYLTFDDGPIPKVTPWVLDILDRYGIKATFFMVADNAERYPRVHQMVVERGHRIGNHTYHHYSGFRHMTHHYLKDVERANEILQTDLFRPPHGWMRRLQYEVLRRKYKVVMWDLVTRDYSTWLDGKEVLANVRRYTRNGTIITFHDSLKSWDKLEYALPRAIEWLISQGYQFKVFD